LPQKQIVTLTFDIDVKNRTISEMTLTTADKLLSTTEIRCKAIAGGFLPERFRATSPDGQIDDLFEISFFTIDGYQLPSHLVRTIRRPDLQDDLDVTFKDYHVNQPLSERIRAQLMAGR
jgi:hypothetical protein